MFIWFLHILPGVVRDTASIVSLPCAALLLFVWHKSRERTQLLASLVRYGLWHGSGEDVE